MLLSPIPYKTNRKRMHVMFLHIREYSVLVHTDTIDACFYTIHNKCYTVKNTPEVNTLYRTLGHVSCVYLSVDYLI